MPLELLHRCVTFGAAKQVSEMTIDLVPPVSDNLYTFPHVILIESKITLLKLHSVSLSGSVGSLKGFSELKSLDLKGVKLGQATMNNILVVCLKLHKLSITKCWGSKGNELRSIALHKGNAGQSIQYLKLVSCQSHNMKLEISATKLYELDIDSSVSQLALLETPLLGSISFSASRTRSLEEALNQFSFISRLHTLSVSVSNDINDAYVLPCFNALRRLTLVLRGVRNSKGYKFAVEFIKNSPVLKQFTFSSAGLKDEDSSLDSPCFVHHSLEEVKLHGFSGVSYEMELARCLLKISQNLKELTLDPVLQIFRDRKERDLISGQERSQLIINELQKVSGTEVRISWTQDN